jgi:hypothetical protein
MMEGTSMHRHRSVRQIAHKIRISSAQVERKSSRATRGHRAKVLPRCETIITVPCAVGERRAAVFPLLCRCYVPRLSGRKAVHIRVLAERARENAGYQRRACCSGPQHFGQRAADVRGVAAAVCCKSAANAAKGGPRPAGRSGLAQFHSGCKSAANAARRRPRPFSCATEIPRTARCTASRGSRSR